MASCTYNLGPFVRFIMASCIYNLGPFVRLIMASCTYNLGPFVRFTMASSTYIVEHQKNCYFKFLHFSKGRINSRKCIVAQMDRGDSHLANGA